MARRAGPSAAAPGSSSCRGTPVHRWSSTTWRATPASWKDLSAARPDLVAALRAAGERELKERRKARARFVAGDGAQSATYLEWNHITRLRSLGYLE